MACWFYIDTNEGGLSQKVEQFRSVFDIDPDFHLNTKPIPVSKTKSIVLWSWNNLNEYPDISHHSFNSGDVQMIIDGFISGFGKYGEAKKEREQKAAKLYELYQSNRKFESELNGSFCIIICDKERGITQFITDRLASRPAWYSKERNQLVASNFPSTIAALKPDEPEIDEVGLWSLLATSRHTGNRSLFKGVQNLKPGTTMLVDADKNIGKVTWYAAQYDPNYSLSAREWGKRIAGELLESAIKIKTHYGEVTLFLSGGMDSRVAAAAFGNGTNSLTLTTRENMNSKISARVSEDCGMNHETVYRDKDWYLKSFKVGALIGSGNYKITHAHFTSVFRRDKKYFDQAFTHGDMLENFNKHYFKNVEAKLSHKDFFERFNEIYSYSVKDFDAYQSLFTGDVGRKLRDEWKAFAISHMASLDNGNIAYQDLYDLYFRWQNATACPTFLMLENIRPFASLANVMFDNQLLDTLLSVPHELKAEGTLHNEILKNLNPALLKIPNSNFWLPPGTPAFIAKAAQKVRPVIGKYRRKLKRKNPDKPFVYTEGSWDMLHERYRKDPDYSGMISKIIKDNQFVDKFNFNKKYIDKTFDDFMKGDLTKTMEIDMLFSLGLLLKQLK